MGRPKGSKNKPKVSSAPETNSLDKVDKLLMNKTKEEPKVVPTIETPSGMKTVSEIKMQFNKNDALKEVFAAASEALQLIDLTKTENRTFQTFDRERLRTYMKDPFRYQSQLRNISRYLYRLCYDYRRIVHHYATMICGEAFNIIPLVDDPSEVDSEQLVSKYFETLTRWQRMDFANELVKLLIVAWREDKVCGYVFDDSDQEGGTFFVHIFDNDYCKVSSIENGILRFAFDFSYYKSRQAQLEFMPKDIQSQYSAYERDSSLRWQEIDPEHQICFKVNIDDPTMDIMPFGALFELLVDDVDLMSIQRCKDALSIYKLLVARLKPLSGTDEPDDFEVDINTAIKYYNKFAEALPPEVDAVISPLPIEAIEFENKNNTNDADMLSRSMSNIFKAIGGQILDNDKTGSTIYEAQIINEMKIAQSTLLPQLNRWLNLYFNYILGTDHATIKYIDGVSPYTKKQKRKELLESAQNGMATVLEIGILDGNTPQETISKLHLQRALGLTDLMVPLSTSYTQSGSASTSPLEKGRPTIDDTTELTDEGSETREKEKGK